MSVFKFQQFSVLQKSSGMKICTDTLIFGSMMPVNGKESVLDIGTGTGVLALMAAQLGAESVTAVEITHEAYEEAKYNFENSPWAEHIEIFYDDIRDYSKRTNSCFDLIICNPPFFPDRGRIRNYLRHVARCYNYLTFSDLLKCIKKLLNENGQFYVIIPIEFLEKYIDIAKSYELHLVLQTDIKAYKDRKPHVCAVTFSSEKKSFKRKEIPIHVSPDVYSEESEQYLKPFLLRFAINN